MKEDGGYSIGMLFPCAEMQDDFVSSALLYMTNCFVNESLQLA